MEDEITREVDIEGIDDSEVIEGISEDANILSHSVTLEDETTEKVEGLSEHTRTVSTKTKCGSDPKEMIAVNN